ncbi:hypothetical protein PG990_008661 [Apiospora arundinis]
MAYVARTTSEIGVPGTTWYEGVKGHILDKFPKQTTKGLDKLMRQMEAVALDGLYQKGMPPSVSAGCFRWNIAMVTWIEFFPDVPFPYKDEFPALHGVPICEQYVRYWWMKKKASFRYDGSKQTVCSSTETTPIEIRAALAQRVRPDSMIDIDACKSLKIPLPMVRQPEPLEFPLPTVRQPELCIGLSTEEAMKQTLVEAASILGPEFTLSFSTGGGSDTTITFGLAPGVDHTDEEVISRARQPIDWLEDWWVNVLERDTNLLQHLQHLKRQRFMRPHENVQRRVRDSLKIIKYDEELGARMGDHEKLLAAIDKQEELDRAAESIASEVLAAQSGLANRAKALVDFVENGHRQVRILNREDRLRVVKQLLQRENAVAAPR